MLDTMASDTELNVDETTGPPVLDKLTKRAVNRSTVPMPDKKLEEKLEQFKIQENCKAIMAPFWMMSLYKNMWGNWTTGKESGHKAPVLAKAAAGILNIMEKQHMLTTSTSLAVAENTKVDPDSLLNHTNQMLAFQGMLNKNCHLEEDSACKALSLKK